MILHPTLEEARALTSQGNLCPLYAEVPADLETPVSAYLKVARGRYSFLLESVEGGERLARYSFIGTEPYRTLRSGAGVSGDGTAGDPLLAVEAELSRFKPVAVPGLPRFTAAPSATWRTRSCATSSRACPRRRTTCSRLPESVFLFTDTLLVFDHLQHKIKVVSHFRLDGDIEAAYRQAAWRIEELVGGSRSRWQRCRIAPPRASSADAGGAPRT